MGQGTRMSMSVIIALGIVFCVVLYSRILHQAPKLEVQIEAAPDGGGTRPQSYQPPTVVTRPRQSANTSPGSGRSPAIRDPESPTGSGSGPDTESFFPRTSPTEKNSPLSIPRPDIEESRTPLSPVGVRSPAVRYGSPAAGASSPTTRLQSPVNR
ncbi:MAG: hypothetical protein QGG36_08905 [Pirellulaceae bacterium]|nr:hypothetical protein [Pirellulaceae bacterium]